MTYLAVDGDNVGRELERLLFGNHLSEAKAYSVAVEEDILRLRKYLLGIGAEIIFCAGDSLMARLDEQIELKDLPKPSVMTWSIGIGSDASSAVLALKKAKGLGRNRIERLAAD